MPPNPESNESQRPASRAGQALILMSSLVSAAVFTLILSELQGVIRPFFIAIFLSLLVKPLTGRLNKQAGVFGYAFAIALLFGVFAIGNRIISADMASFGQNKKDYRQRWQSYEKSAQSFVNERKWLAPLSPWPEAEEPDGKEPSKKVDDSLAEPDAEAALNGSEGEPGSVIDWLDPKILTKALGTGASFFFGVFGELIVILVMMMLLLLESDRIPGRLQRVYGDEKARRIIEVFNQASSSVTRYVSLKVWVSLLTAAICMVVMKVAGLHYAITFGIVVFLFNFIPYLGSVFATLFPCAIALLQFESPLSAVWLALALSGAQQVVGNFIEPRIQGKGLSISPVVIVLALGFWGWLWGIGGMILAVPITVTVKIILEQFETTRQAALMLGGDG